VVVCFFGDGAANEGSFHEALNLAGEWNLPVVWLCENNQYGMSMSQDRSTAGGSVADRASAYGMPGATVDGNDVVDVFETVAEAADRARSGHGPTLVEAVTYRYRGHSKSDRNLYRTQAEIEEWRTERDPIARYEGRALENGLLDESAIAEAREAANQAIKAAISEAYRQPDATADDLEESACA
jgi:pyruvate dehydrogenase E1 component alpha subunit